MHCHVHTPGPSSDPKYALFAGMWAVGTVALLVAVKGYAYWQSGSAAMLATLLDSLIDGCVSVMMLAAIRYSMKPADEDHRYGHGKIEGMAALFQSALMLGAGLFLVVEALPRFFDPRDLSDHMLAVVVAGFAIVLSLGVIAVQSFALRRVQSLAVEADKAHYTTDVALNGSVMAALMVDYCGGPGWVDPGVALFAGLYYGWTGFRIGRKGADMLMDKELSDEVRDQITQLALTNDQVKGIHDLRTRQIGMKIRISFDIELDPSLNLKDAHDIALDVERDIVKKFSNAEIMIHMDPHGIPHEDSRHKVPEKPSA